MNRLIMGTVMVGLLASSAAVSAQPTEPFPVSEHGPQASAFRISSPGTSHARVVARITLGDLVQDCADHGATAFPECSETALRSRLKSRRDAGAVFHASANCPAGTITTDTMHSTFARRGDTWVNFNPRPGDDPVLDGSNASGAPLLEEQFNRLCPKPRR